MRKLIGSVLCLLLIRAVASDETTTKTTVARICASTDYKQVCEKTLRSANDPKDFIKAAIAATLEATEISFNLSAALAEKITTRSSSLRMALEDCRDLLSDAVDELRESLSLLGNSPFALGGKNESAGGGRRMKRHVVTELQNWLSAVVSYQDTCLDQFAGRRGDGGYAMSSVMKRGIGTATRLTSNALAMVNEVARSLGLVTSLGRRRRDRTDSDGGRRLLGRMRWGRRMLEEGFWGGGLDPDVVVAQDGSGRFRTITDALAAYDRGKVKNGGFYVVYVKAGLYKEYVTVDKHQPNVLIYGDGARRTIVSGDRSHQKGYRTMKTATFQALGRGFIAKSMGFENTAGPEAHQAVALRVQGDQSAVINCAIDGYQDSLYCHTHRQFYHNCTISGTIDFIFGSASAVIQDSVISVRRPMDNQQSTVIAQGRVIEQQTTGIVVQNCKIVAAEEGVRPSYLGRPWKAYSRAVVMESEIGSVICPEGWMPWQGDLYLDTLCFEEYGNYGAGAGTGGRVTWKGFRVIGKEEAVNFTAGEFIQGVEWLDWKVDDGISLGFAH